MAGQRPSPRIVHVRHRPANQRPRTENDDGDDDVHAALDKLRQQNIELFADGGRKLVEHAGVPRMWGGSISFPWTAMDLNLPLPTGGG